MLDDEPVKATALRCELCSEPMTAHAAKGSPVRYHHCARCGRWVASSYGDELVRAGTARLAPEHAERPDRRELDAIKGRLEAWLRALDESDPYFILGVHPASPLEQIRERFHELALAHHPDKGGDPEQMRRVLAAWERIRNGKRLNPQPAGAAWSALSKTSRRR